MLDVKLQCLITGWYVNGVLIIDNKTSLFSVLMILTGFDSDPYVIGLA